MNGLKNIMIINGYRPGEDEEKDKNIFLSSTTGILQMSQYELEKSLYNWIVKEKVVLDKFTNVEEGIFVDKDLNTISISDIELGTKSLDSIWIFSKSKFNVGDKPFKLISFICSSFHWNENLPEHIFDEDADEDEILLNLLDLWACIHEK